MDPELEKCFIAMVERMDKIETDLEATNRRITDFLEAERIRLQKLKRKDAELTAEHVITTVGQTALKVDHFVEVLRKFMMNMGYSYGDANKGINWTPPHT